MNGHKIVFYNYYHLPFPDSSKASSGGMDDLINQLKSGNVRLKSTR